MTTMPHKRAGRFRKVGENLYQYSSNGVYYAVFRSHGKLIWKRTNAAVRHTSQPHAEAASRAKELANCATAAGSGRVTVNFSWPRSSFSRH